MPVRDAVHQEVHEDPRGKADEDPGVHAEGRAATRAAAGCAAELHECAHVHMHPPEGTEDAQTLQGRRHPVNVYQRAAATAATPAPRQRTPLSVGPVGSPIAPIPPTLANFCQKTSKDVEQTFSCVLVTLRDTSHGSVTPASGRRLCLLQSARAAPSGESGRLPASRSCSSLGTAAGWFVGIQQGEWHGKTSQGVCRVYRGIAMAFPAHRGGAEFVYRRRQRLQRRACCPASPSKRRARC